MKVVGVFVRFRCLLPSFMPIAAGAFADIPRFAFTLADFA
jgi:hypothetical protein